MEAPEIITVDAGETTVECDGGEYYGHPKIYLTIGPRGYVDCYYCGRRFVRDFGSDDGRQRDGRAA